MQVSVVSTCNGLLGAWLADEPGAFMEHDSPWHGHEGYMTSEEVHQRLQGLLADEAAGIRYTGAELSELVVSRALGALQQAQNNCVVFRRASARNQPKGAPRTTVRLYKLVSNPDAVEPISTQHLTGRVRAGVSRAWNDPKLTSEDSDGDDAAQADAETKQAQSRQPAQPKPPCSGARKSRTSTTTSEVFSEAWCEIHAAIAQAFQHDELSSLEELVQAFADAKLPSLNVAAAKWQHVLQTAAHDIVAAALSRLWDEVRPKRAGQKRAATAVDRDAARHSPQLQPAKTARHQIDWLPAVVLALDLQAVDETNRLIKKAFSCGLKHLLSQHGTPDAQFAFLMAELDALNARSCKERALVDSQLRRAQVWADRFRCPNIRRDRDRMLTVQQQHFGPVERGETADFDAEQYASDCFAAAPVVSKLWFTLVTCGNERNPSLVCQKFLAAAVPFANLLKIEIPWRKIDLNPPAWDH